MELNEEQIKQALECCGTNNKSCSSCPLAKDYSPCSKTMADNALALINSQEQRIDAYRQELGEVRVALAEANKERQELTEENERLRDLATTKEIEKELVRRETRSDTVRKMQERLIAEFRKDDRMNYYIRMTLDQIAKEMVVEK